MNKAVLAVLVSVCLTHAEETRQMPHSERDYNKRYLADQLAPIVAPGQVFYVSPSSKQGADGTRNAPFPTLEAARDAVRVLKRTKGLPAGGVHVVLLEGVHRLESAFVLEAEDSGTAAAPVVYRGVSRDGVKISGGVELDVTGISTVQDPATLERLHPAARGKVMVLDVPERLRGCFAGDGNYGMIAMDGHLLTLAQWPNVGYNHMATIPEKGPTTRWLKPGEAPAPYSKENPTGGTFTTRETLSPLLQKEFERTGDMQVQGYLHNDWFFQREQVGSIHGEVIQLLRYTRYGILDKIKSIPRRVRLVNVLAELDQPGEWYYDRIDGKLFVWPIKGFDPKTSSLFVLGTVPAADSGGRAAPSSPALVALKDTSCVTLRDITFENAGKQAVSIAGGEHNLIAGCVVRNGLGKGIVISGGRRNGITGCDFYGLESAFTVSGGDVKTLQRCYNFATNNDIHSMRRRGYGMIGLHGVGLYFAHNLLHDMNGAVSFRTVDSLLEYNEFYNIGYEMGDFNVAYTGAVWYTLNNVVRYNFVHHLLEPGGHPVCGFRNDDGGMGLTLYGNVFYRPGRGAAQFAGPLNRIENNIALDCNVFWWTNKRPIDPEGIAAAWKTLERFGRDLPHGDKGDNIHIMEKIMGEEGWLKSPWIDEFPELARVLETNPWAQTFSVVDRNYYSKIRQLFHVHGGGGDINGMENPELGTFVDLPKTGTFRLPKEIDTSVFVDIPSLDFNFRPDFKPMAGFKPIPFDGIGLVEDEFRADPPDKAAYRRQVYNKFRNDKGGRYNAAKVNARYPVPHYLGE